MKKGVKKVSLKELLGESGSSKPELYQEKPEKRKYHLQYRTPRDRAIVTRDMAYTRPLATDAAADIKLHELVMEFVNNGFEKAKAYAAVYGVPIKSARWRANKVFASTSVRAKIREVVLGVDGVDDLPKEYLIERLMYMIDNNILDYVNDDGRFLNIRELKALPEWCQLQIKKLDLIETAAAVVVKDENGAVVMDEEGMMQYAEVHHQRVTIELYDKQKAMELLAKAMKWIMVNTDVTVNFTPQIMVDAHERIRKLRRESNEDIEGQAKRIAQH